MIGYVLINNSEIKRSKLYMEGQVCFDDKKNTAFEEEAFKEIRAALIDFSPKSKSLFYNKLEEKSINEKLKIACHLLGTLTKTESKYISGELDEEFIDLIFQHHIEGDWFKLTEIKYVKFEKVNYNNMKYELKDYILNAINKLS